VSESLLLSIVAPEPPISPEAVLLLWSLLYLDQLEQYLRNVQNKNPNSRNNPSFDSDLTKFSSWATQLKPQGAKRGKIKLFCQIMLQKFEYTPYAKMDITVLTNYPEPERKSIATETKEVRPNGG
jgi:hypothetical protein